MVCEKCMQEMIWSVEGSTQGWRCPMCGWNIITTYIDEIDADTTEYSLYIRCLSEVDTEKIKFVATIANVNFVIAKRMLEEKKEICILKGRAPKIKSAIVKLQVLNIDYDVKDTVQVVNGPLEGFVGTVQEINKEKQKVKVLVSMFGRETPVELEFSQVQKV